MRALVTPSARQWYAARMCEEHDREHDHSCSTVCELNESDKSYPKQAHLQHVMRQLCVGQTICLTSARRKIRMSADTHTNTSEKDPGLSCMLPTDVNNVSARTPETSLGQHMMHKLAVLQSDQ